jgi:hypothetical protein
MLLTGYASARDEYGGSWLFCGGGYKPSRHACTVPIQFRPLIRFRASLAALGQKWALVNDRYQAINMAA